MTKFILTALLLLTASAVVDSAERACGNSEPDIGAGVVTSPNYPQNYDNNANCVTLLQANTSTPGAIIMLTFGPFTTEECCDMAYLYDGPSIRSPLITRLSGSITGKRIFLSTQPYMTVYFVSDSSTTMAGFNATYETAILPSKTAWMSELAWISGKRWHRVESQLSRNVFEQSGLPLLSRSKPWTHTATNI